MKRTIIYVLVALVSTALLAGCGAYASSPVTGFWFTQISAPLDATSNAGSGKVGTGTCSSILGLIAMGDCSIDTAAKSAGITKIHHVDSVTTNILGIYATFTTKVYGE